MMEENILAKNLIERAEKLPTIDTYLSASNLEYKNEEGNSIPIKVLSDKSDVGIMIVDMPPGKFPRHLHEKSIEFGVVLDGDGYGQVEFEDGNIKEFRRNEVFVFNKKIKHTWTNIGYCRVLFITVPKDEGYPDA